MDILIITKVIFKNTLKNRKLTPLTVKIFKSLYFLIVKGPINPKIISLGEKL